MARFLLPVACLVLSVEASTLRAHSSSAVSLLLRSNGPNKVDTKTLVASLNEVGKGLQAEDKAATEVAGTSKSQCRKTDMALRMALNKGKRTYDMATDDYDKTSAQVNALQASLGELQGQIANSNTELDTLQAKLKKMRKDKGLLKKGASSALRQVEAVIAKTYLRESTEHRKGPSDLAKKASTLEQLSESLSFLQSESEESDGEETHEDSPAQAAEKSKPVLLLKEDKQAVVRANAATQRGFNEEEKKVIDLVEVERKKLQDLEDNMADLQPAISNKLKQAMEINRTLDAASQGMERDSELMASEKKKCDLIEKSLGAQKTTRTKATNDVLMASKVLESMDVGLFLSKDLVGLKHEAAAPSLLQLSSEQGSAFDSPVSLLQEGEDSGMDLEQMVENYGSAVIEGPFDGVTKMIGGLIASLKAQANEEVNQHQFCQDGLSKNRRERIAKKNGIDTLTSTIRWSKMAIVRLDDDLKYLGEEMQRLADVQAAEAKELVNENKRIGKEVAEHKLADEVITKAVVILNQLCDLKGASLLQTDSSSRKSSKIGSRFGQCEEAAKLLKSASKEVKALDGATKTYQAAYKSLSEGISSGAKAAAEARNTELTSTKSARAQRASELATANKDVKEAAKELLLIDDAKKELEHSCSHVETREEKMARRKEEIDALKEALNVLQGEAIPA